jgi:hypothetical protein
MQRLFSIPHGQTTADHRRVCCAIMSLQKSPTPSYHAYHPPVPFSIHSAFGEPSPIQCHTPTRAPFKQGIIDGNPLLSCSDLAFVLESLKTEFYKQGLAKTSCPSSPMPVSHPRKVPSRRSQPSNSTRVPMSPLSTRYVFVIVLSSFFLTILGPTGHP